MADDVLFRYFPAMLRFIAVYLLLLMPPLLDYA